MRAQHVLLLLLVPILAQRPLPSPPWQPPPATFGAQPSPQSQIPNPHWSALLGNLLYFYEAQRSGKLPVTKRTAWRNDSALTDGQDNNIDLSGGYYDAGDYIKATFPLAFTVMSICWGATDFGTGYDISNQTPYLDDMLRWSLDYLMKAHPKNDTLYVLVGEDDVGNTYWGGDRTIPTPRPSFQVNDTHPGTDVAAAVSAAFSSCSSLYFSYSFPPPYGPPATLANTTYASTLLTHAQDLYSFAVNATGGQRVYQQSVPAVATSYPSSGYSDELALAAAFLARAENSTSRWKEAVDLWNKGQMAGQNGVFNWDSKVPGVMVLFAQMAQPGGRGEVGGNLTAWKQEAERYFDNVLGRKAPSGMTGGGLLFYDGDSDDASLNPALNAAMLLTRYAQIASTDGKQAQYLKFAKGQVDYALGKNPMSVPYVVGMNPNSPSNPHSALASGGTDIGKIDTSPPQEAYVLYGAVVGGPDRRDRFWDIRSDWPETEPALDENAPMLTLAAMHLSNGSTSNAQDPPYTSLAAGAYAKRRPHGFPCDAAFMDECGAPPMSKGGEIALGVVLTVVGLAIIAGLAWWCWTAFRYAPEARSSVAAATVDLPTIPPYPGAPNAASPTSV